MTKIKLSKRSLIDCNENDSLRTIRTPSFGNSETPYKTERNNKYNLKFTEHDHTNNQYKNKIRFKSADSIKIKPQNNKSYCLPSIKKRVMS